MFAVELSGVDKTYSGWFGRNGTRALAGVSLSVPAGSTLGLIGPNGAGKTTLVKALLGIVRPSAGTISVLGGPPDDPRARRRIGYLPERLQLPPFFTPLAFLGEVARLKRVPLPRAGMEALLERVGLGREVGRRIGGFSKGMRQRLGLAAALVGAPELLILDEPTDGIDPLGRVEVRRILEAERARGTTILLNSHLLSEAERVCDRVAILAGGRVVREGALETLCAASFWRVRFEGEPPAPLLVDAGFRPGPPGQWLHDAPDASALNAALDRARGGGALISEVRRETRELEDLLAEAVRSAA